MLFANRHLLAFSAAGCLAVLVSGSIRAEKQPAGKDLTPTSFAGLHKLIRPHPDEWRHLQVQWQTDVVAARKKAAAEDKPIIICYTGGAGYNEPLGVC
jgi:hypothetical protein